MDLITVLIWNSFLGGRLAADEWMFPGFNVVRMKPAVQFRSISMCSSADVVRRHHNGGIGRPEGKGVTGAKRSGAMVDSYGRSLYQTIPTEPT
jgi:hypothetical protein